MSFSRGDSVIGFVFMNEVREMIREVREVREVRESRPIHTTNKPT